MKTLKNLFQFATCLVFFLTSLSVNANTVPIQTSTSSPWLSNPALFTGWNTLSTPPGTGWVTPILGTTCNATQAAMMSGVPKIVAPGAGANVPSYYRYTFNLDGLNAAAFNLKVIGDDRVTVYLNGIPIGSTIGWGDSITINNPQPLRCGENLLAFMVEDLGGACKYLAVKGSATGNAGVATITGPTTTTGSPITLTTSGGGTYLWNAAGGNATTASISVNPTVPTTYTVTVTDLKGCKSIASHTVKPPCISVKNTSIVCGPIVGGVQTYTVSGLISNGNSVGLPVIVTSGSGMITSGSFSPNPVPAGASNIPFSFSFIPNTGVTNPCWVIKYIDDNGQTVCLFDFCLPLPPCKPCIDITQTQIVCDKIVNGVQTYIVSGFISNGNSTAVAPTVISSSGLGSGFSPNPVPANATNVPFSFIYTPTSVNPNPCWTIQYTDLNGNILCKKEFCLPLPICKCLELTYVLKCNPQMTPNTPQQYVYMIMGTNPTSSFTMAMSSSTGSLSPTTITIPANTTFNIPVYYSPTAGTTDACIKFGIGTPGIPIPLCKTPKECIPLPYCPCSNAVVLTQTCEVINGVQTLVVKGAVTSFANSATTLSVTSLSGGTATLVPPPPALSVPAYAMNYAFTIHLPNPTAALHCFEVTTSNPKWLCKDTICVKNPCPPVKGKCCPTTTKEKCCTSTFEIKYEFVATLPTPICGMIVKTTSTSGVTSSAIFPTTIASSPSPFAFSTTGALTTMNTGSNTSMTYYLTVPVTSTVTMSVQYITCAGDTCTATTYTLGKNATVTDAALTGETPKDKLFGNSYKLDFSNVKNKNKIKSISFIANGTTTGQDVFFAVTGREQFGNENQALIPLWDARQGLNTANFTFREGLNSDNYKGQGLNIVTKGLVKDFTILMFDEEGLLVSSSTVTGALTPITVSAKELKSSFSSLSIAPNPANETVNLLFTLDVAQKISVDLYDVSGKWLKNIDSAFHTANQSQPLEFNVSEYPSGLYFVRLTNENGQIFTQKLNVIH